VAQFIATTLRVGSPLVYVALGGMVAYRAGVFHLGLEGLMLTGAFSAVAVADWTENVWLALGAAVLVDLALSFVFWLVIGPFRANVIIAGLGLTSLAVGGTSYALVTIFDSRGQVRSPVGFPQPVHGADGWLQSVSELSVLVWVMPIVVVFMWMLTRRTRFGLRVTAAGEFPFAARSAGADVPQLRLVALLIAGALCAVGGADLALGSLQGFSENMTQGRGFLAFAAVLFGAGQPIGTALAAMFFGLAEALGIRAQLLGVSVPPVEFVLMVPFIVTIVAVWLSGLRNRQRLDVDAGFGELRE
jgi:ABC-type uncharacterized transport system permease subunit